MNQQLTLPMLPSEEASFDNFVATESSLELQSFIDSRANTFASVYLQGAVGAGKSHWLQAMCQQHAGNSIYLPMGVLAEAPPEVVLENLDTYDIVCVDDIEMIAGNKAWEAGLFHLYNRLQDAQKGLFLVASQTPYQDIPLSLNDLHSRLGVGLATTLQALTETDLPQLLQLRSYHRGILLTDDVQQFLLSRSEREAGALVLMLQTLDEASYKQKKRLTIPFVKEILNW